jgi:hypothetical protein
MNNRKEFFNVDIDNLEQELKQYKDLTIEFRRVPEAPEYRQSLLQG